MERVVKFIAGYKSYITFLICLLVSLFLLFSNKSAQVSTLQTILVDVSSSVTGPFKQFFQVFTALEENKELKAEIMRLRYANSTYLQQQREIDRLKRMLELKDISPFKMKAGEIIGWGSVPIPSTITINLGTADGVKKNDPVVSSHGLVGKVMNSGRNASICQLLTDRNFKVSSIDMHTGAFGLLRWRQDEFAVMEVQKSAVVNVGDTIVTSEHGNIYPEGIRIGQVDSFFDGPELFKIVNVRLFVDYLQLYDIAVITETDTGMQRP